jgi:arginase
MATVAKDVSRTKETARRVAVIGVPSSAGAHTRGLERAPGALRAAGLLAELKRAGVPVVDLGDLPPVFFQVDPAHRRAQSADDVVRVARMVADVVATALESGDLPLVIGGDCTITLGVISGFLRAGIDPALFYVDGGLDIGTPETYAPGRLDSMGMAHLVDEPGAIDALADLGPRRPLLRGSQIVPFGYKHGVPQEPEDEFLRRHEIAGFPIDAIDADFPAVLAAARTRLAQLDRPFVLHFDVDVHDFVDFPVADVPEYNSGLTFAQSMTLLDQSVALPTFAALVVTEFNPAHAGEDGTLARQLVRGLAEALAGITSHPEAAPKRTNR